MLRVFRCSVPTLALFGVISAALAQDNPAPPTPGPSLFTTVRTDVVVIVRLHNTGADLVEITMREPDYPLDLLKLQVQKMCEGFDAPPRGLYVGKVSLSSTNNPKFQYVKATFATNGMMDADKGVFKIQPILRAFAGVPPPHTVSGFTIDYENVAPSKVTLQKYSLPNVVESEARYTSAPPLRGIEYRIRLLTQDPAQITFPDEYEPRKTTPVNSAPANDSRVLIIVLICVAGLAAGALVYFAMLRSGLRAQR